MAAKTLTELPQLGECLRFAGLMLGGFCELDSHQKGNCLLLAIKDPSRGGYAYNPADAEPIRQGMILIVMGDPSGVRTLGRACGATMARGPTSIRGVATVA